MEYSPASYVTTESEALFHFSILDSTNSWAKRNFHLFDQKKITLITAEEQTAGRGRFNHRWISPPHQNLYATFCFFLPARHTDILNISQVMALSIFKILILLGFEPTLKWPNDVLIGEKKLAGILTETVFCSDHVCLLIGVGINVNMPLTELLLIDKPATSLLIERGAPFQVQAIAEALLKQFKIDHLLFVQHGFRYFLPIYRECFSAKIGTPLSFNAYDRLWKGTFLSINSNGSLNLQLPSGEIKNFLAGEILA